MYSLKEKTISSEMKYEGYIVNVRRDEIVLSNGKQHFREVVEHPGGVVIIPVLDDNKILFVKQWRYPVGGELIELPAGKLSKGEDPFLAAKRELKEETGFMADSWQPLGFIYSTPGFCDEKLHLYKASNLTLSEKELDYGEIIESLVIDINQAWDMIKEGKITDAKTIVGLSLIK
jgi:ADP-ribose pyrophosphatase